jgi:hypothetical protein
VNTLRLNSSTLLKLTFFFHFIYGRDERIRGTLYFTDAINFNSRPSYLPPPTNFLPFPSDSF